MPAPLAAAVAAFALTAFAAEEPPPLVSSERLMDHVRSLTAPELRGRRAGTPGEEQAAQYLARQLEAAGVKPHPIGGRMHDFDLPGAKPGEARSRNVLGWIEGAGPEPRDEVIVLGAHYDHLGETPAGLCLGADDNASGAAVVLEAARFLEARSSSLARNVAFVFFGAEEQGLVGSRSLVRDGPIAMHRVIAMINIDMIGRPLVDQKALAPLKSLFKVDGLRSVGVIGAREDATLHFLGVEQTGGEERWIAADAPPGHRHWNQGGTYRHRDAPPLEYDEDHGFPINSWSYDAPRFTRPFYYGRAAKGMVCILMFDRASSPEDEVRFSLFKLKLPKRPRPAWDFQYVIRKVERDKEYGFRARLIWKPWVSAEDCLAKYERWAEGIKKG